jgi:hypothetical protein
MARVTGVLLGDSDDAITLSLGLMLMVICSAQKMTALAQSMATYLWWKRSNEANGVDACVTLNTQVTVDPSVYYSFFGVYLVCWLALNVVRSIHRWRAPFSS